MLNRRMKTFCQCILFGGRWPRYEHIKEVRQYVLPLIASIKKVTFLRS